MDAWLSCSASHLLGSGNHGSVQVRTHHLLPHPLTPMTTITVGASLSALQLSEIAVIGCFSTGTCALTLIGKAGTRLVSAGLHDPTRNKAARGDVQLQVAHWVRSEG